MKTYEKPSSCTVEHLTSELSMAALRAKVNRDISRYYALRGRIEMIYALATNDFGQIAGKTANRNVLI